MHKNSRSNGVVRRIFLCIRCFLLEDSVRPGCRGHDYPPLHKTIPLSFTPLPIFPCFRSIPLLSRSISYKTLDFLDRITSPYQLFSDRGEVSSQLYAVTKTNPVFSAKFIISGKNKYLILCVSYILSAI